MKKIAIYILLSFHIFSAGNIGFVANNYFSTANALSNTWDFSIPGDYTLSTSTGSEISGGLGLLKKRFEHIGFVQDNTDLNALQDIVVDGNYAYVASNANTTDRVTIVDISDPINPFVEAVVVDGVGGALLNGVNNIEKIGNYIYASATTDDAIQIIDVTDPTAPVVGAQVLDLPTSRELDGPRGGAVQGDYFYVATQVGRAVVTIDISDPAAPVYIDTDREAENLRGARDLVIVGDDIIATVYSRDRVSSLDISTADDPVFDDTIQDNTFLNGAWHISASGSYAYVSSNLNDSVEVIDISDPSNLSRVASIPNGGSFLLDQPRGSTIIGDTLFVTANTSDAVNAIDISNPLAPVFLESITDTSGGDQEINGARAITNVGNRLYIAAGADDSVEILDFDYTTLSPTIIPNTAFNFGTENLSSFTETLGADNAGSVTYQVSRNNGTDWYYYNGSAWTLTTGGVIESSSASIINTNINDFNAIGSGTEFLWKAFLTSDGNQKIEIDGINVVSVAPPSPAPGGVDTNLSLWLKADEGTSTTTNGATLTTWSDQSGNSLDATAVNAPTYRNDTTNELNFNPVVDFDGVNDYMRNLANGADSDTYYLVIVPDDDIEGTSSQGVPFSFDCESGILSAGGPCDLPFGGIALGSFTLSIPDEVITHALGSSANYRSSKTAVVTYPAGKPLLIGVNDNAASSITNIYEKGEQIDNAVRNTYQTLSNADYGLGRSMDDVNTFLYDGKIAEVINYDGGLTITERQKIESYLAIKYGITLNNGTQNYIATDNTTVWSTLTNSGFNNNIFGIGRDDLGELGQIKSQSVNDGAIVTIEAQGEGTNIANSFIDISDKEFFISGNNTGGNSWSAVDAPAIFNILSRKWKIQETGDVGNVRVSFDVDDTNFDVPDLSVGTNYFFVYDSDSDGSLADETPTSMTNTSGSIWESGNVNIANGQIYTIATQASSNNIPTDIDISSLSSDENVVNGTTLGVLSTVDADLSDTHTYSLVSGAGDTDNNRFVISGSNINFNHSPDHEIQDSYNLRIETDDGNGGTYQESFTVSINDIGEATTSFIDFENSEDDDKYTVGSGQWNNNTVNPNTGTNAIESNNLGIANTQSCFQVTHDSATDGFVEFEYSVSSQVGSDELIFLIDDVEQDAFSGIIPYTTYTSSIQTAGPHTYKWCYIKDGAGSAGTDNAYIDDINFINSAGDVVDPVISSTSVASGSILPGGNHDILINYSDADSGIDTGSYAYALNKWDGVSAYGADISGASMSFISSSSTQTSLTFDDLESGKYRFTYSIDDNAGNTAFTQIEFFIDKPEFIVSTPEIDLGNLTVGNETFSPIVVLTVKTIGAPYRIIMNRSSNFTQGTSDIQSWDSLNGYGYDSDPLTGTISTIASNEVIANQIESINTNGELNTYTYNIQIGALVGDQQEAGDYLGTLDFSIELDYE